MCLCASSGYVFSGLAMFSQGMTFDLKGISKLLGYVDTDIRGNFYSCKYEG